jgi:phage baseplate assembly protein gpV
MILQKSIDIKTVTGQHLTLDDLGETVTLHGNALIRIDAGADVNIHAMGAVTVNAVADINLSALAVNVEAAETNLLGNVSIEGAVEIVGTDSCRRYNNGWTTSFSCINVKFKSE